MKKIIYLLLFNALVIVANAQINQTNLSACSFLGGSGASDGLRAAIIQSDGTIVIAGRISNAILGTLNPNLLNGSSSSTLGAIVRLSADGRSVLSVTRLANEIWDIAVDGNDNIYVAALGQGLFKLNPTASAIVWSKTHAAHRVSVSPNGSCVALDGLFDVEGTTASGSGTVYVYDANGTQIGNFAGYNKTQDVAIDDINQSVYLVGWQNKTMSTCHSQGLNQPIQISYIKCVSYTGTQKWKAYDWSGDQACGTGWNKSEADNRAYHVNIGEDNQLYVAFRADGGDHIFRYDPYNFELVAPLVGGDAYHQFYNSKSEAKTVFGRYDPVTGNVLKVQQFTARNTDGSANTAAITNGDIAADKNGNTFLIGLSGCCIPYTYDPIPSTEYAGGPFFLCMSPDFVTRQYLTRPSSSGNPYAMAVRTMPEQNTPNIVIVGNWSLGTLDTKNAIQSTASNSTEGWFQVYLPTGASGNKSPIVNITSPANESIYTIGDNVTINASASDVDGSISKVQFYNGSFLLGTVDTSPYSYTINNIDYGTYNFTAVATDNNGVIASSGVLSVSVNPPASSGGGTGSFVQDSGSDGIVSIEAEHFTTNTSRGGYQWIADYTSGFSGESAMVTTPNNGGNIATNIATTSPGMEYKVKFVKTGTHYIWTRGIGANGNDDSFHVGLDGVVVSTSDKINGFLPTWTWSRSTMDNVNASFNITTIGEHTLNVWMREDGLIVDKILLTTNANFTPLGAGPLESQREGGNKNPLVSISSPLNDTTITAGSNLTLTANASDTDGSIAKVAFYQDNVKVGEDFTSPYNFVWTNTQIGKYNFIAIATDNNGAISISSIRSITVNPGLSSGFNSFPNNGKDGKLDKLIYPIPSTGIVNIDAPSGTIIELFNLLGSKVYSGKLTSNHMTIDLIGKLGVYMVNVNKGEVVKKLIIQ